MSNEIGLSNTPKVGQIYSDCPLQNQKKTLPLESVQNHHIKQELGGKSKVLEKSKSTRFAAYGQAMSEVNIHAKKPSKKEHFIPAVKKSAFVKKSLAQNYHDYAAKYEKMEVHALTLSKMEVHKLYPSESNSLRDRKRKAKEQHIHFSKSLTDIRDFLLHLGPKPAEGYTVDRIKSDKAIGYSPNNLRWASPLVQTENRGVTQWHEMPDGTAITTNRLADKLGLKYNTLWKRLSRGRTVASLLGDQPKSLESWDFPPVLAGYCNPLYYQNKKRFTTLKIDWFILHFDSLVYGELREQSGLESPAVSNAGAYLAQAKADRLAIVRAQNLYEERKLNEIQAILGGPVPANDTTPQQPLPVAAQARHQPRPRPQPDVEQPYRPSAAEIAETMTKLAELAARPVMAQ